MARSVVVVDDDQDDLGIMKESLREVDPNVVCTVFDDSEKALQAFQTRQITAPDVIFLDVNMPRMSGDKLLLELRRLSELLETVIVVQSTSMPPDSIKDLTKKGATYAFPKAAHLSDLQRTIRGVLALDSAP